MTLGITVVYPVQWGVAIRGAHGSYRAPARCSVMSGFCLQFAKLVFRYFAEETRHKMLPFVQFP